MTRHLISCLLCWLFLPWTGRAAGVYHFDYNTRCQQAYAAYLSLRISEGDALIKREFIADPHNLMATYLSDYGDFLSLIFANSPEALLQRQSHQEERIALLDRGDDNDPWKNFCKGGVYLRWSVVQGWYGNRFRAATTFRKSYQLLKSNGSSFPDFEQNAIFLGMEEAAAGTIPDEYGWLAGIFGMKGNVRSGAARLKQFLDRTANTNSPLRAEAVIYYQYIRFYLLSQQSAVWSFVSSDQFPVKGNLLHSFIRANMALNSHHADVALQTLQDAALLPGYDAFPSLDYELGNALLMKLDPDCVTYYNRFLGRNKGSAFVKDALMKRSLSYYLHGDKAKAAASRAQISTRGATNTDADKQAQRFAREDAWPNTGVLQLRLLTDGGYYTQALSKAREISAQQLNPADQLEFYFRSGRACEETGDANAAARLYVQAINAGRDRKEQFAARAALQLGLLYEQRRQVKEALQYFNLSLSMRHHDFQASIDQQAKAGINRLN